MSTGQDAQSVITAEMEITGTVKSSGAVRIDGKLDGDLNCSADAVIGKSATIKGNLSVNSVTVEGTIQGNIAAKDKIEMKSTARVTGDISAKRLAVEDGVTFVGKSEVNPAKSASAPQPAAPRAEASDEAKPGIFGRR
jgi:cytoskeletal protein CcmA (bactofilin family)